MVSNIGRTGWRTWLACGGFLASVIGMQIAPTTGYAEPNDLSVPGVPANIAAPADNQAFLVGHAVGTQDYVCLPSGASYKFVLVTPRATLLADDDTQVAAHFFSPNPLEDGVIRVTWQNSQDASTVWGQVVQTASDPDFVAQDAIPWLLIQGVGSEPGPAGGGALADTTYVQRLNTAGGLAPATGCASPSDIGNLAFVPYTADYFFYRQSN